MTLIEFVKEQVTANLPAAIIEQKKSIINNQTRKAQWPDLTEEYANKKVKKYGFKYPMLKATGELLDSFKIDISDSGDTLSFTVANSADYYGYANALRNVGDFSDEDISQLEEIIGTIIKMSVEEYFTHG